MSKVTLKIEVDEEAYKIIMNTSVIANEEMLLKGSTKDLKMTIAMLKLIDAIHEATPITESDDAVSRQAVMELLNKRYCHKEPYERKEGNTVYKGYDTYYMINFDKLKALPSVLPKREQGEWIDCQDEGYVECPKCGSATNCDGNKKDLHYCFSCGAEMTEGGD